MKTLGEIELQLRRLGIHNKFWSKPEIKELQHILANDEVIKAASTGRYQGGLSLLVATDRRLLLIDKKMWFLNIEDVRFDMILEVDYCARLLDSTVSIRTFNKVLNFTAMKQAMLRNLTGYIQDKVMEIRHVANHPELQQNYIPMPQPIENGATEVVVPPPPVSQQFTLSQTAVPRPNSIRRIGAYPTASFTTQRRFLYR